jgi:hypothetical protein
MAFLAGLFSIGTGLDARLRFGYLLVALRQAQYNLSVDRERLNDDIVAIAVLVHERSTGLGVGEAHINAGRPRLLGPSYFVGTAGEQAPPNFPGNGGGLRVSFSRLLPNGSSAFPAKVSGR